MISKKLLDRKPKQLLMMYLPPAGAFYCRVVYFSFVAGQI